MDLLLLYITLLIQIGIIHSESTKKVIPNLAHGTVFNHIKTIDNSHAYWEHTFAIPFINELKIQRNMAMCRNTKKHTSTVFSNLCVEFSEVMDLYRKITRFLVKDFKDNVKGIKLLLPYDSTLIDEIARVRRGLIDLGAEVGYHLFGLARNKDLISLKDSLVMIHEQLQDGSDAIKTDINKLMSAQIKIDERVNTIKFGMVTLHDDVLQMKDTLTEWSEGITSQIANITNIYNLELKHIKQFVGILHANNVQQLHVLSSLHSYSFRMLSAVQTLITGFLPIELVLPKDLEKVLGSIAENLLKSLPSFTITHPYIAYYYAHKLVSFAHSADFLFIKLRVPINSGNSIYNVYEVISMPLPVVHNYTHGLAEIAGQSRYLAVSSDYLLYKELDALDVCTNEVYSKCPQIIVPVDRMTHSCTSSLFFNDTHGIDTKCMKKFTPNAPKSFFKVAHLGDNDFAISAMPQNFVLMCPQKPAMEIDNLPLTLLTISCECSLQADYFFLPPGSSGCINTTSQSRMANDNYKFLKSVYQTAVNIGNFSMSYDNVGRIQFDVPHFEIENASWDHVIEKDTAISFDLNKIKESFNSSRRYFATKQDQIMYHLNQLNDNVIFDGAGPVCGTFLILHVLTGLVLLYLYLMYRRVGQYPIIIATPGPEVQPVNPHPSNQSLLKQ